MLGLLGFKDLLEKLNNEVRNNTRQEYALRIDVTGKRVTRIAPIFEERGRCYEQSRALSKVGR
jgi:hypothetical protein